MYDPCLLHSCSFKGKHLCAGAGAPETRRPCYRLPALLQSPGKVSCAPIGVLCMLVLKHPLLCSKAQAAGHMPRMCRALRQICLVQHGLLQDLPEHLRLCTVSDAQA